MFGRLLEKNVTVRGCEAADAILSNAQLSHRLFGPPRISVRQMMEWIAAWVRRGGESLDKPRTSKSATGRFEKGKSRPLTDKLASQWHTGPQSSHMGLADSIELCTAELPSRRVRWRLTADRRLDERRHAGFVPLLYRHGGGPGVAVGVHTTHFAIRDPPSDCSSRYCR